MASAAAVRTRAELFCLVPRTTRNNGTEQRTSNYFQPRPTKSERGFKMGGADEEGNPSDPHFGPVVEVDFQRLETGGQRTRKFPASSLPLAARRLNMRPAGADFGATCGGRKFAGFRLVQHRSGLKLCSRVALTAGACCDAPIKLLAALSFGIRRNVLCSFEWCKPRLVHPVLVKASCINRKPHLLRTR